MARALSRPFRLSADGPELPLPPPLACAGRGPRRVQGRNDAREKLQCVAPTNPAIAACRALLSPKIITVLVRVAEVAIRRFVKAAKSPSVSSPAGHSMLKPCNPVCLKLIGLVRGALSRRATTKRQKGLNRDVASSNALGGAHSHTSQIKPR